MWRSEMFYLQHNKTFKREFMFMFIQKTIFIWRLTLYMVFMYRKHFVNYLYDKTSVIMNAEYLPLINIFMLSLQESIEHTQKYTTISINIIYAQLFLSFFIFFFVISGQMQLNNLNFSIKYLVNGENSTYLLTSIELKSNVECFSILIVWNWCW